MQESFETIFPDGFSIPQSNEALETTLLDLFQPDSLAYQLLITALKLEIRDKFGSPEISNLQFEIKRFDAVSLKGRMRINYALQLIFSCSDITNNFQGQHTYWNFEINRQTSHIYFEGEEYGDLRSTADEL
jgi:hypothetical protein